MSDSGSEYLKYAKDWDVADLGKKGLYKVSVDSLR